MSQPQAAARFAVGLASVKRYLRQWRTTGTLAPRPHPGRPAPSRPPYTTASSRCSRPIPMRPSPTTARGGKGRRASREPEHDVPRPAAGRLDGEKKSLIASERDEAARAAWRAMAALWDATPLVFVDESGTQTNMTPRNSRAPRGQRAVGAAPRNHGKNTTLIAALSARRDGSGDDAGRGGGCGCLRRLSARISSCRRWRRDRSW